jgi:hypothetical protein
MTNELVRASAVSVPATVTSASLPQLIERGNPVSVRLFA